MGHVEMVQTFCQEAHIKLQIYTKNWQEEKAGGRGSLTHNTTPPPRKDKGPKEIVYEESHIAF